MKSISLKCIGYGSHYKGTSERKLIPVHRLAKNTPYNFFPNYFFGKGKARQLTFPNACYLKGILKAKRSRVTVNSCQQSVKTKFV